MKIGVVALCIAAVLAVGECRKKVAENHKWRLGDWVIEDPKSPRIRSELNGALQHVKYKGRPDVPFSPAAAVVSAMLSSMIGRVQYVMEYIVLGGKYRYPVSKCFIYFNHEVLEDPNKGYLVNDLFCASLNTELAE